MKPKPKSVSKSFKATLERMASNLGWVIVRIPFDVPKVWGTRGMLRVQGEINGFAFRTSLFHLEPDTAKRVVSVPGELQRILNEDRSFRRWFDHFNYSTRKWICDQVANVKNPAARVRRAEQVAEQLLSTMEAELELPPILKLAFASDPRAYKGWQSMTLLQRRNHLLGIFYCRTPEARDRRIAKMLEAALAHTGRRIRNEN